jgi:glyceraldehyde 3-phosphate dehydrogenase
MALALRPKEAGRGPGAVRMLDFAAWWSGGTGSQATVTDRLQGRNLMTTTVGINGFGRVGRAFMRRALERDDLEVVAVNDVTDARTLTHLLEFDSTYGRLGRTVEYGPNSVIVDGRTVPVLSVRDPAGIDWGELGASIVIESTGKFRAREDAALHLKGGARKVLISAPGKGADLTVVVGVNDGEYDPRRHDVVSAASCTTNCVVPMAKVLHDEFGLVQGFMTTIHAYTGDQMLLDGPHKDLRRARSAAINIVPTSTGAARTAGVVVAELAGRLDGVAVRVPVEDGSLTDLAAVLGQEVTAEQVNDAFERAAGGSLAGVLRYSTKPLVSRDIIGDPASCVFDSGLTQAAGSLVKVFGWYDNEWGYTCRLADLAALVGASQRG